MLDDICFVWSMLISTEVAWDLFMCVDLCDRIRLCQYTEKIPIMARLDNNSLLGIESIYLPLVLIGTTTLKLVDFD